MVNFESFFYPYLGITLLSIISSFIIIFLIKKKDSIYSKMIYKITLAENIFVFSHFLTIVPYTNLNDIYLTGMHYLTFGIIKIDKKDFWVKLNFIVFIIANLYTNIMNLFLCLEMILTLKNPISHPTKRARIYSIFTFVLCLTDFLILLFQTPRNEQNIKPIDILSDYYSHNNSLFLILNVISYICTLGMGIVSICCLLCRFCHGSFTKSYVKYYFVISHAVYVVINAILYFPWILLIICNLFSSEVDKNQPLFIISVFGNLSIGFILFFIKITETAVCKCSKKKKLEEINDELPSNITPSTRMTIKKLKKRATLNFFEKDQPLASLISSLMNVEFMCCILYGLTNIFEKIQLKKKRKAEKKKSLRNSKRKLTQDSDLSNNYLIDNSENNKERKYYPVEGKDFTKVITHNIQYQNIGGEEFDLDKFEVNVRTQKSRKNQSFGTSCNEIEPSLEENNDIQTFTSYQDSFTTQLKKIDAEIKDYCPRIFRILHKADNNIDEVIATSLSPFLNIDGLKEMKKSQGKSGSFFFFTSNNKFLIKTITNEELDTLLNGFMEKYYIHIINNPDSLLARLYGLYTITIKGISQVNIVLMQNINSLGNNHKSLYKIFDLKGSLVERKTKNIQNADKSRALKDLDFLYLTKIDKQFINFSKDAIMQIVYELLQKDLIMLTDNNLMDYSILFFIFLIPDQKNEEEYKEVMDLFCDKLNEQRLYISRNSKYLYLIGIIDYLQEFNLKKFLENKYKAMLYGKEVMNISAVAPTIYSNRMLEFAKEHIFVRGEE